MPAISSCPKCQRQVSIPQGADAQARVRCPLCDEEYVLAEALALAPPELVLLDVPAALQGEFGAETAAAASETPQDLDWTEAAGASSTMQWDPDSALGHLAGEHDEITVPEEGTEEPAESEREKSGALVAVADEFDFGQGEVSASSATDFDTLDAAVSVPTMLPLPKRKQGPSFGRQMIGVFGGGIVGLSLGYLVLLWIGGPRRDFLKIGGKLPAFMVPASFHPSDSSDTKFDFSSGEGVADWNEPGHDWTLRMDKETEIDPGPAVALNDPNVSLRGNNIDPGKGLLAGPDEPPKPNAGGNPEENPADTSTGAKPKSEAEAKAAPEPKPTPPAKPAVGAALPLPNMPRYTATDLGTALKDASDSREALIAGSLNDPDQKTVKLEAFRRFCRLGEVYTLVEGNPNEDQLAARQAAVGDLLTKIADSERGLIDLGLLAENWLSRDRKDKGVLLVGTVQQVENEGKFTVTLVVPLGQSQAVTVITPVAPPWQIDDTAVVLGCIVSDPKSNVTGYTGDAAKAVWAGLALKGGPAAF